MYYTTVVLYSKSLQTPVENDENVLLALQGLKNFLNHGSVSFNLTVFAKFSSNDNEIKTCG